MDDATAAVLVFGMGLVFVGFVLWLIMTKG